MLRSMTGFGAAAASEVGGYAVRVEARSVNHRHLLVKTRSSAEFLFIETELERLTKQRLSRGSVSIHIKVVPLAAGAVRINPEVVRGYRSQVDAVARALGIEGDVSLETLLSLPGVLDADALHAEGPELLREPLLSLVDEALTRLIEMRAQEGAALQADLEKNAQQLAEIVSRIEGRMPEVVRAHQANLEKRIEELLRGRFGLEPADLAREAAVLADRLDVSEEVSRLKSHLEQLQVFLERGGAIGRKLDFLVQEVFREVNTIGSKCSDATVAHWVVDAKAHAERMREQVQNVE